MRQWARLIAVTLLVGACVPPVWAKDLDAAREVQRQNAELIKELRAMRAQMAQMQNRLDALEAKVDKGSNVAGANPGTQPPPGVTPAGSPLPPPGVTPAGQPIEPAVGVALGSAFKKLEPGPVTRATSLPPGYANAPGAGQGVIVPGIEGVPKVFIPDIGAVGDFTFRQSNIRRGDARYDPAQDKFLPRDTQLILFSPIDPYTNAQISFDKPNDGSFDIEEAFLVFNKMPYNLTLRAGQFRQQFGLINTVDTFQLPMVNRPQALANYIGQDGFVEPGVELNGYIPNPWRLDLKADFNMLSGVNPVSYNYREGRNFDFLYMGSLTYSRDLFTTGALTAGFSVAGGPGSGGETYLEDPFVQIQYAPDQRHIWTWSTEALVAERKGVGDHGVKRGVYSLLDYNFRLRWHAGLLVDMADVPDVPSGTELGLSPILTYFVSDNTRLRLQYTHATASRAVNGPERASDEVYLQATFSLGNLKPLD